jgi:hypothetical protein
MSPTLLLGAGGGEGDVFLGWGKEIFKIKRQNIGTLK